MKKLKRSFGFKLLAILAIAVLPACSGGGKEGQSATVEPGAIKTGRWAAEVTVPGGVVRFALELKRQGDTYGAVLVNGDERVPVSEVSVEDDALRLFFPAFNSRIEAALEGGVLNGSLTLNKRGGTVQAMPLRAVYAQGYTFSVGGAQPEIDVTGRWAVDFFQDDGVSSKAIGEFRQDGSDLRGTFLTPTGDYRYLTGTVTGGTFELSCFDGAHAFLFNARVGPDGSLEGDFWSGTKWHERWTARRDDNAALPDPYELTFLREGYDGIAFSFPDVNGKTVSLDDHRFDDKVVIVTLAGSWCPNCHDEAAFLTDYYNENKDRGLEIVTLMYEHLRDEQDAVRQIERFRKKHNIEYTLLYAGYSGREEAQQTLPMLNHIMSFPTTIIIGRDGEVRRIHTGFSGPGTGQHYDAFKREFSSFVNTLLAE
jgi:peroxiredoxin